MQRLVRVDGKVRTDCTYPAGFMDVIDIEKTDEHFRLIYDSKGRFVTHRITKVRPAGALRMCMHACVPVVSLLWKLLLAPWRLWLSVSSAIVMLLCGTQRLICLRRQGWSGIWDQPGRDPAQCSSMSTTGGGCGRSSVVHCAARGRSV